MKATFLLDDERYVRNTGGPWGSDIPGTFFLVLVPFILLALSYWWWKERNASLRLLLTLLLAGGMGNFVDRVIFGYVRDFWIVSGFPAFNPADVFLTISVILLFFLLYKKRRG